MAVVRCCLPELRRDLKREVEVGCHSVLDYRLLQVPTAGLSYSVLVTLFRTAVEGARCTCIHRLLRTAGFPASLACIGLAVTDGLFRLYGLEQWD